MDKFLNITGTIALYGFASLFLSSLLLLGYLTYAWQLDQNKWTRIFAVAQGHDLRDLNQAVQDRVAEMTVQDILELRAQRVRDEEFSSPGGSGDAVQQKLSDDAQKLDAKMAEIVRREKAYNDKIAAYLEETRQAGLAEETRILEAAKPAFAKDAMLQIIRDRGDTKRVLQMLLAMQDDARDKIIFAMSGAEEQKELIDLLQRIGNGEPLTTAIENARDEANATN